MGFSPSTLVCRSEGDCPRPFANDLPFAGSLRHSPQNKRFPFPCRKRQIAAQKKLAMTGRSVTASPGSGYVFNLQFCEGRGSLFLVYVKEQRQIAAQKKLAMTKSKAVFFRWRAERGAFHPCTRLNHTIPAESGNGSGFRP